MQVRAHAHRRISTPRPASAGPSGAYGNRGARGHLRRLMRQPEVACGNRNGARNRPLRGLTSLGVLAYHGLAHRGYSQSPRWGSGRPGRSPAVTTAARGAGRYIASDPARGRATLQPLLNFYVSHGGATLHSKATYSPRGLVGPPSRSGYAGYGVGHPRAAPPRTRPTRPCHPAACRRERPSAWHPGAVARGVHCGPALLMIAGQPRRPKLCLLPSPRRLSTLKITR